MSDKMQGGFVKGSTSVSVRFRLAKSADGTEQTGKVAADMTATYWRQGGLSTDIALTDLGAVDAAYSSGGVKEVDATKRPGVYRLDLPDAALAAGSADWVSVTIKVVNCFLAELWIPLESVGSAGNAATLVLIKAKTDNLPSAIPKGVAFTLYFEMRSAANPSLLAVGISPTVQLSKDGGGLAAVSPGTPAEISGSGVFKIAVSATEANADALIFLFSGPGAVTHSLRIYTRPS